MNTEPEPTDISAAEPEAETPPAERIAALEAELADAKDRWMRSEAEMANVRARARRDVEDARQYAVQKFATDVVEAVEIAIRQNPRRAPA